MSDDEQPSFGWKACDPCFKGKIKCKGDGIHSCPTCEKKGIECIYLAPKKRGPKSGALRALQEEVELLKTQLAELSKPGSARTTVAAPPLPLPADSSDPLLIQRLAPLDAEVKFIRIFFMYCNTLTPMICKQVRRMARVGGCVPCKRHGTPVSASLAGAVPLGAAARPPRHHLRRVRGHGARLRSRRRRLRLADVHAVISAAAASCRGGGRSPARGCSSSFYPTTRRSCPTSGAPGAAAAA